MFEDPPWDDDESASPVSPPVSHPQPTYQPVSKARRETHSDQDELPFDLDED